MATTKKLFNDEAEPQEAEQEPTEKDKMPKSVKTSRLIVKNLPKHLTDQRFKDHFATKGRVTDVKILKTKDGRSRQFGFVGFATVEEAKEARKYFNNTYIDTSKVAIDFAQPYGDSGIDRPWSKYSKGSSANTKIEDDKTQRQVRKDQRNNIYTSVPEASAPETKSAAAQDLKLAEFLAANTKQKTGVWANDDSLLKVVTADQHEKNPKKRKAQVLSQPVANKKRGGEGLSLTRTHVTFDDGGSDDELYEELPSKRTKLNEDDAKPNGTPSNLDYFKSKTTGMDIDIDKLIAQEESTEKKEVGSTEAKSSEDEMDEMEVEPSRPQVPKPLPTAPPKPNPVIPPQTTTVTSNDSPYYNSREQTATLEDLSESGRIFIRNLPFTATEEDLNEYFNKYGTLSEIHIARDRETKDSKGFGFVLFMVPADALKAFKALDGKIFQGRLLHLMPAKLAPKVVPTQSKEKSQLKTEFQKKRDEKLKETAQQDFNWNTLFMRTDTVANAMASQLDVNKAAIFDREAGGSVAVRLALGEASIINDTKKFLEKEGVAVEALQGHYNKDIKRSDTTILIKNIPFSTQLEEVRHLFQRFGSITHAIMPPSKALVLVEFFTPSEAKAAFKALSYKQFKDAPLMLEWAPTGVIKRSSKPPPAPAAAAAETKTTGKLPFVPAVTDKAAESGVEEVTAAETTLYVKNLNFNTTEQVLRAFVEKSVGKKDIRSISIASRVHKGQTVSSGFGFVEFSSHQAAVDAIKKLQGSKLEDHALQLRLSKRKQADDLSANRKAVANVKASTKLMVRNVPFEATKQELQDLFQPFGELKSVRLPRKQGGKGHRGFAFIEYLTKDDAKNAKESVNTHLYGRRFVIEFATEDDTVDSLREKTLEHFTKHHL